MSWLSFPGSKIPFEDQRLPNKIFPTSSNSQIFQKFSEYLHVPMKYRISWNFSIVIMIYNFPRFSYDIPWIFHICGLHKQPPLWSGIAIHLTCKRRALPSLWSSRVWACEITGHPIMVWYCGWKKSCITLDGWNPMSNGINHLSTGAGFLPSTVVS
jgi:hypothetical protein